MGFLFYYIEFRFRLKSEKQVKANARSAPEIVEIFEKHNMKFSLEIIYNILLCAD